MIDLMLRSMAKNDRSAIVICDVNHKIIYMNPAAVKNYENRGGASLVGQNLLDCHGPESRKIIEKVLDWFMEDRNNNMIYTYKNTKENKDVYMVALRDADGKLLGYYEKHEYRNPETAKLYDFTVSLV